MSTENYKIKYSSTDQFYIMAVQKISDWHTQLNTMEERMNAIADMESFRGRSADSVKAYIAEVIGVLLLSIRQTLIEYQSRLALYKAGYYDIDPDIYACLPQETMLSLKSRSESERSYLSAEKTAIGQVLVDIYDLLPRGNPSQFNLNSALEDLESNIKTLDDDLISYESAKKAEASGELAELIAALKSAVVHFYEGQGSITSYQSGDFAASAQVRTLYEKVSGSMDYTARVQDEVLEASEDIQEVFVQQQKDYEEACEARQDKGWSNIIMGAVSVVAGGAAIILTAGAATPVVVTAAVSGTCAMAYGVSNMAEGAQDVYYGSIGDLSTNAFNPIRDTVFGGNQGLYDAWGSISMTVAGLCVPVSGAVNTVAGQSSGVIAKKVAVTVVKETVKDVTIEAASGYITEQAADAFDLSQTESTILNIALEVGIDKGVDGLEGFVTKTVTGSEPGDFVEGMSYDDAIRYNQYWDAKSLDSLDASAPDNVDINAPDAAGVELDAHVTVENPGAGVIADGAAGAPPPIDAPAESAVINDAAAADAGTEKVFTDAPFDESGALKPNVTYQSGEFGYNYETDANGRICNWNTDDLQLTERTERLVHESDTPGKLEGDHAGHLAGDRFGGSSELDNIVSQSQDVNLSQYKVIENQWAKAKSEGKDVSVNVDIKYDGDGLRPSEFNVEYTIDGEYFSQNILND